MTASTTRRAENAKARQSRRPSRLGLPAGVAPEPDYPLDPDAGFPTTLRAVWAAALAAPDLPAALDVLLTLGGKVPADVQLRALRGPEEAALAALWGVSWREDGPTGAPAPAGEPPAYVGELGLTTTGRIAVRVPSQVPLDAEVDLVDAVLRVPWSARALADYQTEVLRRVGRETRAVADCRAWLDALGPEGRDELLEDLDNAALRTAPFVLYQDDRRYTNFRERNTLTGKTLWPGHPDSALSALRGLPVAFWSDNDATMVVCLALLVRSASYARIEEANGTQLTVDHVGHLLERTRRKYNSVEAGPPVPPAPSTDVAHLAELADALKARRLSIFPRVQLYREIHGALMHKVEQIARPPGDKARQRVAAVGERLADRLPVTGRTLAELTEEIAADPSWLARPYGGLGTGLEALVHETVAATTAVFEADFAMSRGIRSLPGLVAALRAEQWLQITQWDIKEYFCCVVPDPAAVRGFDGSLSKLADMAWAISSRMQYNSWHFIAAALPRQVEVLARDFFVAPTIPDVAYWSDQHHHGHVAAKVRWSIRSPQAVEVLGRTFNGFVDLRLLRNDGAGFDEQDLLGAAAVSRFVAAATSAAAGLVAAGQEVEVTAFDSAWHWATITGSPAPVRRAG